MNEQQFKVLKIMAEVTSHMDMTEFAQKVCLTPSETIEQVHELAKVGLVSRVGGGYGITEKGKAALRAVVAVPVNMAFCFYLGMDQPTCFLAKSIKEFYELVKIVDITSLEFHLYRGDFENWVRTAVKDSVFADELGCVKDSQVKGEQLREAIEKAAEMRFSLKP